MKKEDIQTKVLGVLADTHLHRLGDCAALADKLLTGIFADIDMVLHAGDQTCAELESCFYPLPFIAVRGNMDHTLTELPQYRIITVCDKKIGLIHGWGHPVDLEDRILGFFSGRQVDAIVYGHSHDPVCRIKEGILLFNPGSPTDKRRAPYHSVGLLEIGADVTGRILRFD